MLLKVILSVLCVFALIAWVGWRYFWLPVPHHAPSAASPLLADTFQSDSTKALESPGDAPAFPALLNLSRFGLMMHWPVALALLLVALVVAGVLALSSHMSLEPLSAADLGRQQHIQAALNPEKLVPPLALPPSVFAGVARPGLETANRDWSRLNPQFLQAVLRLFARMEARGYPLALLEGYRSPERQEALADMPVQVTNARAFQSKHQYGLAVDLAPIKDGRLIISERDPWAMQAYQALGEEAEREDLIWGGRWKLRDFGHVEAPGTIAPGIGSKVAAHENAATN